MSWVLCHAAKFSWSTMYLILPPTYLIHTGGSCHEPSDDGWSLIVSSDHEPLQFRVSSASACLVSALRICFLLLAILSLDFRWLHSFNNFSSPFKEVLTVQTWILIPFLNLVTIGACGTICEEAFSPMENFYQLQFSRCLWERLFATSYYLTSDNLFFLL